MKLRIPATTLSDETRKVLGLLCEGHQVNLPLAVSGIEVMLRAFQSAAPAEPVPTEPIEDTRAALARAEKALSGLARNRAAMARLAAAYARLFPAPWPPGQFDPAAVLAQQTAHTRIYRPHPAHPAGLNGWAVVPFAEVLPAELVSRIAASVREAARTAARRRGRPATDETDRMFIRSLARVYERTTPWRATATPDPGSVGPAKVLFSVWLRAVTDGLGMPAPYTRADLQSALRGYRR